MTTAIRGATEPSFRELVAAEVRAHLARRKISGRQLGRLLGESQTWVSRRLNADTPMDVDDLDRVAEALGMSPIELLASVPAPRKLTDEYLRRLTIVGGQTARTIPETTVADPSRSRHRLSGPVVVPLRRRPQRPPLGRAGGHRAAL